MKKLAAYIYQTLRGFYINYDSRKTLLTLDDSQLKDIGLSYKEAVEEASKPFWQSYTKDVEKADQAEINLKVNYCSV
ncbi:DUF1127 domain-containing protein [Gammaproteobacteria bacterium AS21]|jgi:uncharacterized protein YjiS (DUF1127 family)